MQKFFTDSIISKFIKSFLNNHQIPVIETAVDGDYIVESFNYIYKGNVIRCIESGILPDSARFEDIDVLDDTDMKSPYMETYLSRFGFYDSKTHHTLGRYLEYLRDVKKLNLMHLYNCFSYNSINGVRLSRDSNTNNFIYSTPEDSTVYAIPIRFGRPYTIFIGCRDLRISAAMWDDYGAVKSVVNGKLDVLNLYLPDSYRYIKSSSFSSPLVFSVSLQDADRSVIKTLKESERHLCLLIEVPKTANTSIVVLNGDYSHGYGVKTIIGADDGKYAYSTGDDGKYDKEDFILKDVSPYLPKDIIAETLRSMPQSKLDEIMLTTPLLTKINSGTSYPFNDVLIEYLSSGVISHIDDIDSNFTNMRDVIGDSYKSPYYDEYFRYVIFNMVSKDKRSSHYDINGFIDTKAESVIMRGID